MSSLLARMVALDKEYEYGYFVEEVRQWIFADYCFSSTSDEWLRLPFEGIPIL